MNDFEKQWLQKLSAGLKAKGKEELFDRLLEKRKDMSSLSWSRFLMKVLREELGQDEIVDVMTSCACLYPNENLSYLQEEYAQTKDLKAVHEKLQSQFENFIREYKNLSDEDIQFLRKNGWGMAGILEQDRIVATKLPKQYQEYFKADDKREKTYYYCHCPRVRAALKEADKPLDMNYCYCGAGFYKGIWEYILQRPVRVEMLESVMNKDELCRIAIYFDEIE